MSPPDQGQLVDVRQRRYVVTEVQKTVLPSNPLIQGIQAAQHLSTLERFFQTFGLTLSEKDYSRPTSSVDKRPAKEPRIDCYPLRRTCHNPYVVKVSLDCCFLGHQSSHSKVSGDCHEKGIA